MDGVIVAVVVIASACFGFAVAALFAASGRGEDK